MTIDPGQLRHRVTWQTLDQSSLDARNQPVDTWVSQGDWWALVEPLGGREAVTARQLVATADHRVTMRAIGPIKAADRLVFMGRVLNVGSAIRVGERSEWLAILATEQPTP